MSALAWTLTLLAVAVFWALGAYNRLVGLCSLALKDMTMLARLWEEQTQGLLSSLDQQGEDSQWSNWAALESRSRCAGLKQSAAQLLACLPVVQKAARGRAERLPLPDDVASVRTARAILLRQWQEVVSAKEDLAGSPLPPEVSFAWAHHEALIAQQGQRHGSSLQAYNAAIEQLPASLLAAVFGFERSESLWPV